MTFRKRDPELITLFFASPGDHLPPLLFSLPPRPFPPPLPPLSSPSFLSPFTFFPSSFVPFFLFPSSPSFYFFLKKTPYFMECSTKRGRWFIRRNWRKNTAISSKQTKRTRRRSAKEHAAIQIAGKKKERNGGKNGKNENDLIAGEWVTQGCWSSTSWEGGGYIISKYTLSRWIHTPSY